MSPELEKQLVSLVEAAKQAGSDTFAFVQAQAPEVVAELLQWKAASSIAGIVLGIALVAGLSILVKKAMLLFEEGEYGIGIPLLVMSTTGVAVGIIVTCINIYNLIYVLCAPRLVILEALGSLVK